MCLPRWNDAPGWWLRGSPASPQRRSRYVVGTAEGAAIVGNGIAPRGNGFTGKICLGLEDAIFNTTWHSAKSWFGRGNVASSGVLGCLSLA